MHSVLEKMQPMEHCNEDIDDSAWLLNNANKFSADTSITTENTMKVIGNLEKYRFYRSIIINLITNMTRAVANVNLRMPKSIVSSNATQRIQT